MLFLSDLTLVIADIIENCMFLLWRHLEFYLVYCSPADGGLSLYQLTAQKQQLRSLTGSIVCCSCSCLLHFDQRFWFKGKREITAYDVKVKGKLQKTCLYIVSIHQMALPLMVCGRHLIAAFYSFIDLGGMKGWVSLVGWPGWFTLDAKPPPITKFALNFFRQKKFG